MLILIGVFKTEKTNLPMKYFQEIELNNRGEFRGIVHNIYNENIKPFCILIFM